MNPLKSSSIKAQTFSTLPNKVFLKAQTQFIHLPEESPLLSLELIKKGKLTKNKRFFTFFNDRIIYYKNKDSIKIKGMAFYDFDLKIEWLFHNPKEDYSPDNLAYGFKLTRGSDYTELFFKDPEDFHLLSPFLRKKLNIMNFHFWYKAIKKIGKGNFATVYLVESKETGFQYAVKAFLKDTLYSQKKGKDSIKNEIQIMRSLSHLNNLELREVYETDNSLYLVMELLKGGNMISYLSSKKRFSDQEIHIFLQAILQAVAHMHEHGIMHRDLKPENILLRNKDIIESNICIADFGLSSFVNVEKFMFSRCGTPGFVAPEIFNYESGNKKYGEICDEFSIGVIFHIMLFGSSVFDGRSYNTVVKQNKACEFDYKKPQYQTISNEAKDLLMQLLETDPKRRITAKEALEHEYFTGLQRKSLDINEDSNTVETILKSFNERKFEIKHITELNETLYIPIDLPDHNTLSPNEGESSNFLYSNKPCMNGFDETCEFLTEDPIFKKFSSSISNSGGYGSWLDKESPGLKKAINSQTNPKICFYERKTRHKISNFLDDRLEFKKYLNIKESASYDIEENYGKERSPVTPLKGIYWKKEIIGRKNVAFSPHKNTIE